MSNERKLIAKFETMINTADESLAAELIAEDAIFYAPTEYYTLMKPPVHDWKPLIHVRKPPFQIT